MTTTKTILAISIAAAFVLGVMVSGADDAFAKNKEKLTKLQKECSKEPKKEDKIKAHCELLNFVTDLQDQVDNIPIGDSDWTIVGNNMFSAVSGNVGIGTTTPNAALHVTGSGSDITPNNNGVQITGSDVLGNAGIELTTSGGTPYIDFQDDTTGTDFDMRIRLTGDDSLAIEGGNLGIGTTTPNSKLEVTNGYIELDTSSGTPPAADCNASDEVGRMKVDVSLDNLYVCFSGGWVTIT